MPNAIISFQKLSFVPFYSTVLLRGFVQNWIFYEDIKQRMDHEYPTLSAQRIVFVYASVNIVEFLFWEAVQLSWLLYSFLYLLDDRPELTELFLKRLNYTVPDNDGWKVYSVILIVPMCENWHAQLCNGMSVLVVVCISLVFAFVNMRAYFKC